MILVSHKQANILVNSDIEKTYTKRKLVDSNSL